MPLTSERAKLLNDLGKSNHTKAFLPEVKIGTGMPIFSLAHNVRLWLPCLPHYSGFEWSAKDPTHKTWEGRYDELCAFKVSLVEVDFDN